VAEQRERIAHLGVHRVVEAVEAIGTIERQPGDALLDGEEDVRVRHGVAASGVHAMLDDAKAARDERGVG